MDLSSPDSLRIVDYLLTTTRSVRRRLDFSRPVEREVIERCLEIAIQAPTASNSQNWHFVVVTDPAGRKAIADLYRKSFAAYIAKSAIGVFREAFKIKRAAQRDLGQMARIGKSSKYLADHLHEAPVFVIPCFEGRAEGLPPANLAAHYGSVLPAAWSFMLALRARGLGAAWTTLHLVFEKEVAAILGIPGNVTQVALLPVAYFKGEDFHPAKRLPASGFTHWDAW
jgi:nitroreductase